MEVGGQSPGEEVVEVGPFPVEEGVQNLEVEEEVEEVPFRAEVVVEVDPCQEEGVEVVVGVQNKEEVEEVGAQNPGEVEQNFAASSGSHCTQGTLQTTTLKMDWGQIFLIPGS